MLRGLGFTVILLGVVAMVFGGVFLGLGFGKTAELKEAMRQENVTLGIESELEGEVIDSLTEAQVAGDTVREHRRGIAPSYSDLLGEGRYDPSDMQQLSYAQALNLENYLYLAVVAFGLTQAVTASGGFMLVAGLALLGVGYSLIVINRRI